METELKLCVCCSACRGPPININFSFHVQARRPDKCWYCFLFWMTTVLPLRTAWIADILLQVSLRDVQRQCCWKRGSGHGQRLWDYGTSERNFQCRLRHVRRRSKARFEARLNPLKYWPNIEKKGIKLLPKLLEIEKEIMREVVRGDKHNLRKSVNCKARISSICGVKDTDLCIGICRFSQAAFVTSNNFTHNLFFYFQ